MTSPRSTSPVPTRPATTPFQPIASATGTSGSGDASRAEGHSSSFSSRAMAIRAAHRFTTSAPDLGEQEGLISPTSPSTVRAGTTPVGENGHSGAGGGGGRGSAEGYGSTGTTSAGTNPFRNPSPVHFSDPLPPRGSATGPAGDQPRLSFAIPFTGDPAQHKSRAKSGASGASTPGTGSGTVTPRISLRFRPPRKSIDAGRLSRQKSAPPGAAGGGVPTISLPSVDRSGRSPGRDRDRSGYNSPIPSYLSGAPGSAGQVANGPNGVASVKGQRPRYKWLSQPGGGTGDEPGVDVRSRRDEEAYGHLRGRTRVTVVDYASGEQIAGYARGAAGGAGPGDTPRANTHPGGDSSTGAQGGHGGDATASAAATAGSGATTPRSVDGHPGGLNALDELDMNVRVDFPGERLGEWLDEEGKRKVGPDGKAVGVRWIHVNGLNWEVIKTLTLHYNLHPLAVEDALRATNSPRSKLDFYRSHLYLQLLIQCIHQSDEKAISSALDGGARPPSASASRAGSDDEWYEGDGCDSEDDDVHAGNQAAAAGGRVGAAEMGAAGSAVDSGRHHHHHQHQHLRNRRRSSAARGAGRRGTFDRIKDVLGVGGGEEMRLPEGVEGVFEPAVPSGRVTAGDSPYSKEAHRLTVDQLSAKYMVPIRRALISLFMTRDGIIITMTRRPLREVLHPIYERLEDDQSLLRRSGDGSMLAQAFLDISADLALEVSQTFEAHILNLEASVLVDPQMETVRHLHVLSSQLIRLRRSITPLLHITYNVRDQDAQRSAAASAISAKPGSGTSGAAGLTIASAPHSAGAAPGTSAGPGPGAGAQSSRSSVNLSTASSPQVVFESQGLAVPRGAVPIPGWATPRDEPGSTRSYLPSNQPASGRGLAPAGAAAGKDAGEGTVIPYGMSPGAVSSSTALAPAPAPIGGFFSGLTKVYVGDVIDHLEMVVSSMDQFVATCDHLTDYVFTNASMERLSIVTVIFLPLTFISSFFGMNFTEFPEIEGSVSYFWKVAAPSTFAFFLIFSFSYIQTGAETAWRRVERWRRKKEVQGRYRQRNRIGEK